MSKAAKRKVQRTEMTTEQLAKKAVKDVRQMSDVEKANLREQLDREFKKPRFRGIEGFAEAARRCAAEEAAMLNYDEKGKPVN
jgi:hypothetical protein